MAGMTKKMIIDKIKHLLAKTERVFFTPGLSRLNKQALLKRLDILQMLLIAQKNYASLVCAMGLTTDDLVSIALNGPQDKLEKEMVMWQSLVTKYVKEFNGEIS